MNYFEKHTPGPWRWHLVKVQRDITGPQGQSIAYTRGAQWSGDRSEQEDEANAMLIAAAPDLLLALRFVAFVMERSAGQDVPRIDFMREVRTAIAKATGEAI